MKRFSSALLFAALLTLLALAQGSDTRVDSARNAAKALQAKLTAELQSAMKAGGPPNAIGVCNIRAPAIASELSTESKLRIGRTSLKTRNPANSPDAWERKVLGDFAARKAAGEDLAGLEHSEVVGGEFRYMKAIGIPADMPCLKCHGSQLDPVVQGKLKDLYPNDRATGYQTGDLRGAFTVRQKL